MRDTDSRPWHRTATLASVLVLLTALGPLAHAQTEPNPEEEEESQAVSAPLFELDTVTTSAERTEQAPIDTMAPVGVRGQEEILRRQPMSVRELMDGMAGVTIRQSADQPGARINIRGLEDFGRVNVMIDGARQNFQRSGHGQNTQVFIDPSLVRQVDVVRGPSAAIYGSGALGGVVNFETLDAADLLKPGRTFGGETWLGFRSSGSSWVGGLTLYGAADWVDVLASGSYTDEGNYRGGGDGQRINNSARTLGSGLFKVTMTPNDDTTIRVSALRSRNDYKVGTTDIDDLDVTDDTLAAHLRYTPADNPLIDLNATLSWTQTVQNENRIAGASLGRHTRVSVQTPGLDVFNTSRFMTGSVGHALTVGFDGFRDDVQAQRAGGPLDFTPSGERRVWGAFIQDQIMLTPALEMVAALRYDSYRLKSTTDSMSDDAFSPKLTIGYRPVPWGQVYGSWARAFRSPSTTETLIAGNHPPPAAFRFVPNTSLKPEYGENWELGTNMEFENAFTRGDRMTVKASTYRTTVKDYIGTFFNTVIFPPPGPPFGVNWAASTYGYENQSRVRLHGVELEAAYDTGNWFYGSLSLTRARGKNIETGERLQSGLGDSAALMLAARHRPWGLDGGVRIQARRNLDIAHPASAGAADQPAGAYARLDVFTSYTPPQLGESLRLDFAVDNIFDTGYRQRVTTDSFERGRNFKGTVRVRF